LVAGPVEDNASVYPLLDWVPDFWSNLLAALVDGRVWWAMIAALLIGGIALAVGMWAARTVGLVDAQSPVAETIGVGLALGLLVLVSWWAAIRSGGRSAFTPVAITFAIAIAAGWRHRATSVHRRLEPAGDNPRTTPPAVGSNRHLAQGIAVSAIFVLAVGLIFGATMAPSPRDGLQPVEFMDEAFYSVLGRDVAATGVESIYTPSGFDQLPGLPAQTWYHWGEIWLAAGAISAFGVDPLFARHYIALPLILLVAAALTGSLVRTLTGTRSRAALLFGAGASLFLAPLPLPLTFFGGWARGLLFGVSMYGLAVVSALTSLLILIRRDHGAQSAAMVMLTAGVIASTLPTHLVLAGLGIFGIAAALTLRAILEFARDHQIHLVPPGTARLVLSTAFVIAATAAWGLLTGHGIGASGQAPNVSAFDPTWRTSVVLAFVGFFGFSVLAPLGSAMGGSNARVIAWVWVGTMAILGAGAVAWGARLGDFTMFHAFYGGIAVFAVPAAAAGMWMLVRVLQARRYLRLALAMIVLSGAQIAIGVIPTVQRLEQFGPHAFAPIPVSILATIQNLPPGAKLAYTCPPMGEIGFFWDPRLVSVDAHTGHRIVPLCFQAEVFGPLNGGSSDPDLISPLFELAPQRIIYPNSTATPSTEVVSAFMRANGIEYIFADADHPNTLDPSARTIASSGDVKVLQLP
jgi:hypothetical protein